MKTCLSKENKTEIKKIITREIVIKTNLLDEDLNLIMDSLNLIVAKMQANSPCGRLNNKERTSLHIVKKFVEEQVSVLR